MKPLVVIISGSFIKTPSFLSPLAKLYCHYFGISTSPDHSLEHLQTYLEKYFEVKQFIWSKKVSRNLIPVAQELLVFLKKYSEYRNIILIGKSLGGTIAEIASQEPNFPGNVSKILFLATPHPNKEVINLPTVKKYNIYSPEDNYVSFAKKILYQNFSTNTVRNAANISIRNVRHSIFNQNREVKLEGEKVMLFDLYLKLIQK